MQDCFRKYPEVYGSELADDEDEEAPAPEGALAKTEDGAKPAEKTAPATPAEEGKAELPKKATDATEANEEKKQ
jgi:intermembrane space import and assembly protein 40